MGLFGVLYRIMGMGISEGDYGTSPAIINTIA
jgi:hypothetical protein